MEAFKLRLGREHKELGTNLDKATLFIGTDIFNELTEEQQYWHRRQVFGMEIYFEALTQRIELLFSDDDWKELKEMEKNGQL
ncbi:MAG: hypothetical protein LUD72_13570 [Bacteroidales bacterium]|nr:hypothetical protein [Bacteroidales bacterium]